MSEPRRAAIPPDADQLMAMAGAQRSLFLSELPRADLEAVLGAASMPSFDPQDPLSSRHAPDDALHVLLQGSALERSWPSSGEEAFVRPVAVGELVGITHVLQQPSSAREIRAIVRTVTLRVPGPTVRAMIDDSPGVARSLLRSAVLALSEAEVDRVVLSTGDAMTRVTRRITELALTWGSPGPGGVDITLPVTQEQLGAWAGVSRETTVKCLHWLRDRDLIVTSRRHIRVRDLPALEDLGRRRGAAMVVPRHGPAGRRPGMRR